MPRPRKLKSQIQDVDEDQQYKSNQYPQERQYNEKSHENIGHENNEVYEENKQ